MQWLLNLKVGTKLIASFIVVLALMGVVGYFGASNMSKIDELLNHVLNNDLTPVIHVGEANTKLLEYGRDHYRMVLTSNSQEIDDYKNRIQINLEQMNKALETYSDVELSEQEKQLLQEFHVAFNKYHVAAEKIVEMASYGNTDGAIRHLLTTAAPLSVAPDDILAEIVTDHRGSDPTDESKQGQAAAHESTHA